MTRRGFLGLVGSVPFFGFLKGGESAEAKSSPVRGIDASGNVFTNCEIVGSDNPNKPQTFSRGDWVMLDSDGFLKKADRRADALGWALGPAAPKGGAS